MHTQKYQPSLLTGSMLDAFLSKGWFRMGQSVFTTHFLRFQQQFYPAVWLRYRLTEDLLSYAEMKLKKIERKFRVDVSPWRLEEEQEHLFTLYREHSGLVMSPTLNQILLDGYPENIFDTWQVTIRNGDQLIGLGVFDLGEHAAAGISNIYHPDYKKYSLGKMLMLLKIRYSFRKGFSWFYPGYAVPGYPRFDYKLDIGKNEIQYYHSPEQTWLGLTAGARLPDYLKMMEGALDSLLKKLRSFNVPCRLVYYPAFDLSLSDDMLPHVVTDPVFLLLGYNSEEEMLTIAKYSLDKEGFSISNCVTLNNNGWAFEGSQCICFDVLQVIESTDAVFGEGEILKIIGAG
ncbi:MAG: arginyl-tRNA--protein transferase [Chitinophagaceae bacterium]|nr:arginyl-tRNA--protein transferase [Chitinophagaceae bacterium]